MEASLESPCPGNLPTLTDDQDSLQGNIKNEAPHPHPHFHSQMFHIERKRLFKINGNRYECMICSKSYQHKCRLNIHMRSHTGEKPYKCSYCGKGFSFSGNLNVHKRTHTGEKPYRCHKCEKAFKAHGQLKEHEVKHMELKPFVCMKCSKAFTRKSNLKLHNDIHLGFRHFECTVQGCHKYFTTKGSMNKHIMGHVRLFFNGLSW